MDEVFQASTPSGSMAQTPIQQRAGNQHKLALAIGKPPAIRPRQIGNAAPPTHGDGAILNLCF